MQSLPNLCDHGLSMRCRRSRAETLSRRIVTLVRKREAIQKELESVTLEITHIMQSQPQK